MPEPSATCSFSSAFPPLRPSPPRRDRATYLVEVAILAAVYFVAGKLGLMLAFVHPSATAVWPPTGIALAALLVLGYRVWPGVFMGAFLINLTTGGSVATSLGIALGNTLEGLVGAYLVNRFANGRRAFDCPQDLLRFAGLAAGLSTAISATVGVTSLTLGGHAPWADFGRIWMTWWLGNMGGDLIVAPFLVLWSAQPRVRWRRIQWLEASVIFLAIGSVGMVVFGGMAPHFFKNYHLGFLCMPVLIWAAVRFGQRETATAVFLLACIAIWGATQGLGPFGQSSPNESLLLGQAFLGVTSVTAMALAAAVSERRHSEKSLRESEEHFRLIVGHVSDAIIYLDVTGVVRWSNAQAGALTGRPLDALIGRPFMAILTPEAAATAEARLAAVRRGDSVPPLVEFEIVHPDGRVVWVEANFASVLEDGMVVGRLLVARDITERKRAETILQVRIRQQAAVAKLGQRALSGLDLPALMTEATVLITQHLDTEYSKVLELLPNGNELLLRAGVGWKDGLVGHAMVETGTRSQAGYTLLSTSPVIVADIRTETRFNGPTLLQEHGVVSGLSVIIQGYGGPWGVLGAHTRQQRTFTQDDVHFLQSVSNVLASAIERTRAEDALKESEARHRAVLESALDCIISIDHQGRVIEFNTAAEATFGYTRESVLGRPIAELIIPPALRERHHRGLARYLATGETSIIGNRLELTAMRADGTEFPAELTVTRVGAGPQPMFTAFLRDITHRKRAEEALQESRQRMDLAIRGAGLGLWDMHIPTGNVAYNRRWAEMLGYTLEDIEPHVSSWEKLVHPDDWPRVSALWNAHLAGDAALYQAAFRLRGKSGEWKWIQSYGQVLERDRDGKPLRALGFHLDITERKEAEEERRELYERLQASHNGLRMLSRRLMEVQEQERRHLAREMHDEIVQAVTAAKITVQQALHAPVPPAVGAHLAESVRILDHTLQQVRSLALDLRPSLLDDLGLVPALKWLVKRHANTSDVAMQVSAQPPDIRPGPETELACYRVAQEALTNAVRHARANRVSIDLACSGQELALTIRDDGIGFDTAAMFSRAAEGESLGLLGMQERVTLTGGRIDFSSSPGHGTEVRACFPLTAPSPSHDRRA